MRMDRVEGFQHRGREGGDPGGGRPRGDDDRRPLDRRPAGTTSIKLKGKRSDGRTGQSGSARKIGRRR